MTRGLRVRPALLLAKSIESNQLLRDGVPQPDHSLVNIGLRLLGYQRDVTP
jgi:hypothetical protein